MKHIKIILVLFFLSILSCKSDVKPEDLQQLNGFWEIEKVQMPDGSTKEFKINEIKELLKEKNLLEFNRDISQRHTNSILESVNQCGILRLPIIGDISEFDPRRKYVIVDGQHLCNALTTDPIKHKKIMCIVKKYNNKKEVIKDVAKLNNVQKTWNDEIILNILVIMLIYGIHTTTSLMAYLVDF